MSPVARRTLNRIASLLLGIAAGVLWLSCSRETQIGGRCIDITDCRTEHNFWGGTSCIHGWCTCDNPDLEACCPGDNPDNCERYTDFTCRPKAECEPVLPAPPECISASDCPQPLDLRCGVATCEQNKCGVEIYWPGPPIAWQRLGDCKTLLCDATGAVVEEVDITDTPLDSNPCTYDHCEEFGPLYEPLPDGMPCLNTPGVCFSGNCRECLKPYATDCASGEICTGIDCAPPDCDDNGLDMGETGVDCGGAICAPCSDGQPCLKASDCSSKRCVDGKCIGRTATDGIQNGDETGVDCGCFGCEKKCLNGEGCLGNEDCTSSVCYGSVCLAPTCFDVTKNGDEDGVDCGGSCELPCGGY
jgi:hypothetical protein